MNDVAIGVAYHDGTLFIAIRHNHRISALEQYDAADALTARPHVLTAKYVTCKYDEPSIWLGGEDASALLKSLEEGDSRNEAMLFGWHDPAGPQFVNRGAAAMHSLRERVHSTELMLPPDGDLTPELDAFERTEEAGRIAYPGPTTVEKERGHYPSRAVAVLLASLDGGGGVSAGPTKEHDPYSQENLNR